ncbi:MAG: hypothetical protein GC171_13765 [Terrimonas sp.]|nr:hypothetical protein [Terrimonas sp.]
MKKFILFPFLHFFIFPAFSQNGFLVAGKVIDSTTQTPLFGASVFCQNTTQGTTTGTEGNFSLRLRPGGYDLVVTFTGYQSQTIRVSDNEAADNLTILMVKSEKSMEEVVIRSSNEVLDGWEKYGDFFKENFIGNSPFAKECVLQNPDILKFFYYKRSDKLKILAEEPVIVVNNALGYILRYQLDSFVYHYPDKQYSYRGFCFFEEMQGTRAEMRVWHKNRKLAYYGSRLHFMHAYYDKTLEEDGFIVSLLNPDDDKKFDIISRPYDPKYYTPIDSTAEIDIYYPRRISVTYTKRVPENEYLQQYNLPMNLGVQASYVDMLDYITIKENGYYYNQGDWINIGYWSWKNIGDMLPYDYIPD